MIHVAVIGGTSTAPISEVKLGAAKTVGLLLGANPVHVLTSGIRHGLIGQVLDGLQGSSTPRSAVVVQGSGEEEHLHPAAGTLVLVPSVAHRKDVIMANAQVLIALPGGLGTLDEIITFLLERKRAASAKVLVVANVDGYFDQLSRLLENMVEEGFLKRKHLVGLHLEPDAQSAVKTAMEFGASVG